jgi:hypothetical protein
MCQKTAFLDSVNHICNMRQSKLLGGCAMCWVELSDSLKMLFRANLQVRKKRHEGNTGEFKHPRGFVQIPQKNLNMYSKESPAVIDYINK